MAIDYPAPKVALLAANLARPEWFADGNARDKRGRMQRTVPFDGKCFKCVHLARTDGYELSFYYTGAELEARQQHWRMAQAQRVQMEEATETEKRRLADLPAYHAAYRAQMTRTAEMIGLEVRVLAGHGIGGYRYSDEAIEDIEGALAEIADALALGEIEYSQRRQRAVVQAARAETAKADVALQAFIATATAGAKKAAAD